MEMPTAAVEISSELKDERAAVEDLDVGKGDGGGDGSAQGCRGRLWGRREVVMMLVA